MSSKPVSKSVDDRPDPNARYLAIFNQFSASLWTIVFFNTVILSVMVGQPKMFYATKNITIGVQSLALVEVYNSARGYVKSPLFTTVAQVASRLLIVWGVFLVLPLSPGNVHWTYITVSLCWSITEIIRYFYYAQNIITLGNPPRILTLLRYNLFFVLYPSGVASELAILYNSLDEAERVVGTWYKWLFIVVFAVYVPGFYILFTHMLKQRKKTLKALYASEAKKDN